MSPLARIYAAQKLNAHDLFIAECAPLSAKCAFVEGRADNQVIDCIFELAAQCKLIGEMVNNKDVYRIGVDAWNALIAACASAADRGLSALDPSTDQKRTICAALDTLARIAHTLTNKVYHVTKIMAADGYLKLRNAQ